MPYSVAKVGTRYVVISPKGKQWKTTYATRAAAEKGVAYVESRFTPPSPSSASRAGTSATEELFDSEDTASERKALGIPTKRVAEDEDTEGW